MGQQREFITLLGGAAASSVSWPLAARAQQAESAWRVGFVRIQPRDAPIYIRFPQADVRTWLTGR
jgi:hypothetical protein